MELDNILIKSYQSQSPDEERAEIRFNLWKVEEDSC